MKSLTSLKEFRKRAYSLLGNGKDGLFDLMDATLTTRSVPSFAELSLSPVFRRQWPSLYKVLGRSQLPAQTLWSHLMPLMTWQLWLGSYHVQDYPLPWQKPLTHQTPGRVANAFASINFSQHWHTGNVAQTARKVSWLAHRSAPNSSSTISDGEKELLSTPV